MDSITCADVRNVRFCVRLCPVMSSHVQSCPVVSGNVCYPSIGAPFSRIPSPSPISSLHIASDLPEFLTPNASSSWEDRHLPVRRWTLASTKCRTLGQKNGTLKSRTDMFSYPMRRGHSVHSPSANYERLKKRPLPPGAGAHLLAAVAHPVGRAGGFNSASLV